MGFSRKAYLFLLAAVFLVGLGRIAVLPPFEGMDETAHYSRVKAVSFLAPGKKESRFLAADVVAYTRKGPMPPGWIMNRAQHGDDPLVKKPDDVYKVFMDFRVFFSAPAKVAAYKTAYRDKPAPRRFAPATQRNWERQHPGLFYLFFSKVYRALPPLPLVKELLVLRVLNFTMAFAGLVIGMQATARHMAAAGYRDTDLLSALGAAFPFMMPTFFMDLARFGNDDMALFLFGVLWALFLPQLRKPGDYAEWILTGAVMGLTWLVKATMVPPTLGMLAFLVARRLRSDPAAACRQAGVILLAALALGCKGYGTGLSEGHYPGDSALGPLHTDIAGWRGQWEGLLAQAAFTLTSCVFFFTDWSVYGVPAAKLALYLAPAAAAVLAYAALLVRQRKPAAPEALPAWTIAPLVGALLFYTVRVFMHARDASYPIASVYINTLAPALALAFGLGLRAVACRKGGMTVAGRGALAALFSLSLPLTAHYLWQEINLYAGCRFFFNDTKAGAAAERAFTKDPHACTALIGDRLGVLAWPEAGAVLLCAGFACAAAGFVLILCERRPEKKA